jgi:hypothetical protein
MTTPTTVPGLERDTAMGLATEELRRYADLIDILDEAQWAAPTECSHVGQALQVGAVGVHHVDGLVADSRPLDLRNASCFGRPAAETPVTAELGHWAG